MYVCCDVFTNRCRATCPARVIATSHDAHVTDMVAKEFGVTEVEEKVAVATAAAATEAAATEAAAAREMVRRRRQRAEEAMEPRPQREAEVEAASLLACIVRPIGCSC